ncbi:hypothetical protein IQ26_02324 [Mesorhizobium tianshanense]|uniref:Uncharacterized protein n=1 Tax=Mesorhizobium tianshanense TaxID=39844 RepID=A0A562P2D5_9HYPH|nr:hypothetical protein IQ26_02324 [Mesorhizobium tianshanense]
MMDPVSDRRFRTIIVSIAEVVRGLPECFRTGLATLSVGQFADVRRDVE